MANKISGIDGRPVQVGGGAPVSRTRDTTDGRKADTTGSTSSIDVSDTARTLAALEEKIAALPVVNEARVEAVRRALDEGRYHVDAAARRRQDAALRRRPAGRHSGAQIAVDPALTRDHLSRLLAEENTALAEFEALLDREHAALATRDIDALEALADARQSSITQLLKLEDERRGVCSMLGYDTDLAGLAKLIAWCDPQRTLARPYEECCHARTQVPRPERSQWPAGRSADQARRRPARRDQRRKRRAARLRAARRHRLAPRRRPGALGRSLNSLLSASSARACPPTRPSGRVFFAS